MPKFCSYNRKQLSAPGERERGLPCWEQVVVGPDLCVKPPEGPDYPSIVNVSTAGQMAIPQKICPHPNPWIL